MSKLRVCAIVAMDEERAIGRDNALPWSCPADMKRMMSLTTGHTLLMGSTTYLSLPKNRRPLKNRKSVVLTRSRADFLRRLDSDELQIVEKDVEIISDARAFLADFRAGARRLGTDVLWIFGGSKVYELTQNDWDEVYVTRIPGRHGGDSFFPSFEDAFHCDSKEPAEGCEFQHFTRILK